jgi:hypothetical protein
LRKGFFGAKLFITKPFSSDYERQEFESTIQDLKGSENYLAYCYLKQI